MAIFGVYNFWRGGRPEKAWFVHLCKHWHFLDSLLEYKMLNTIPGVGGHFQNTITRVGDHIHNTVSGVGGHFHEWSVLPRKCCYIRFYGCNMLPLFDRASSKSSFWPFKNMLHLFNKKPLWPMSNVKFPYVKYQWQKFNVSVTISKPMSNVKFQKGQCQISKLKKKKKVKWI